MVKQILIFLLKSFRPLLGPASCKFYISCSNYAIMQLEELPLLQACKQIIKRLFRCQPWSK